MPSIQTVKAARPEQRECEGRTSGGASGTEPAIDGTVRRIEFEGTFYLQMRDRDGWRDIACWPTSFGPESPFV